MAEVEPAEAGREGHREHQEHEEHEGLAGTFHEKVISLDTMEARLLLPTALAIAIIFASAVLLATHDAGWPLVSAGAVRGSTLGTVPLPTALLSTITIILAWSFILAGALHAHPALRAVAVTAYAVVGLVSGIATDSMVAALIITLVVFSVVVGAIGLYITDRGNHRQAPHLHHRTRLRLSTFVWILIATTLIYGLFVLKGLQGGELGSFIDLQLEALQFLLIPVLVLAGTDFAEWAEVVSGRLSSLVEKVSRQALVGAVVIAGAGILAWAYLFHDGPGFSLTGTIQAVAPVAIVAVPVCAVGALALRRPTSTRVPFWALGIGAIVLYLGILSAAVPAAASSFTSPSSTSLPPLVRAQSTDPPYSLLVPQAWARTSISQGEVWSGSSGGRLARLVLLWNAADANRSLSSALASPVELESEPPSGGWQSASATTTIAGRPARGEVWTRRTAGVTWTLAGVRAGGLSPTSRALFESTRESFTADPSAQEQSSSATSDLSFLISAGGAAGLLLVAGLLLLLVGQGEVATGGLFLTLVGLFSAAGPLIAAPLVQAAGGPASAAVAPTNLDVAGAYAALGVVLLTSVVPGWRLPVPILRLVLVLTLGFAGLHFLYDGVFGTALGAGQRFSAVQGVVLVAAMLWDVLMSGESFTNTGGLAVPRHTRVLIYLGYTLLVVTTVLYLGSVQVQGGGSTGQEFESDSYPQLGIYALGPPLLITFFLVNLGAWRRARPLPRPDSLDQVDRSILDEVGVG